MAGRMTCRRHFTIIVLFVSFSGCTVGLNYTRPQSTTPKEWAQTSEGAAARPANIVRWRTPAFSRFFTLDITPVIYVCLDRFQSRLGRLSRKRAGH